jgi:hypothetical protein
MLQHVVADEVGGLRMAFLIRPEARQGITEKAQCAIRSRTGFVQVRRRSAYGFPERNGLNLYSKCISYGMERSSIVASKTE